MVVVKSDVGNVRRLNEDYAIYKEEEKYKIYIVADGMGGHNAGEVASEMAAQKVIEFINNNLGLIDDEHILEDAVKYANKQVYDFSHQDDKFRGMGTTIVICFKNKSGIKVANVGDSSCYGIGSDGVIKLTKDHSLVQELLDSGSITEEEARNHCRKNVITRAIGTKKDIKVDIFDVDENKFNLFMLCSDGLTNELSEEDFSILLNKEEKMHNLCEELVNLAKVRGGRDNITVILFGGEV